MKGGDANGGKITLYADDRYIISWELPNRPSLRYNAVEQRSKILIVDDEPFNVDYLEQELEDLGYETATAGNGQEALDQVAAAAPDLILLDVMMPVMDGFAACRILKDNEDTRLIPIVFMTALDAVEDRVKGIEAGADDFLTKPVNHQELIARIQTTLRLKHTVDKKLVELGRIKDHFAKFVPETVQRMVAENPEAPGLEEKREQDVSVLFLDITGYTRLSQEVPAAELNVLVERYFSAFLDNIRAAGGDINETAGDGLMAVFQDCAAPAAVDAALAVLATTEELNQENSAHPLSIHIGVNSGRALVGATRLEGARGTRWTFTANGPVTNLAARLADAAEPGQILVGPETVAQLGDAYQLQNLGTRALKNITAQVEVHAVLDKPPS